MRKPKSRTKTSDKPKRLQEWFFQTLAWIYRAHLGFLMGKRFLMIEQIPMVAFRIEKSATHR